MVNAFDADIGQTIQKLAHVLKEKIKAPAWTLYVKTGPGKERPPTDTDWFYMRAASDLRTVYVRGPIGVQKLRVKYGNKKNRGHKPEHVYKAAGSHIRKVLQQLEKSGLIKQVEKGVHKGRVLTPKGTSFLDKIAVQLSKQERKDLQ